MRGAVSRKAHEYMLEDGKKPYSDWLKSLRDKRAAVKVVAAVRKMEAGNFGDSEPVGEGVSENKLHGKKKAGKTQISPSKGEV